MLNVSRTPLSTIDNFTHVVAKQDPRPQEKGLIYQVAGGWTPVGRVENGKRDGGDILFSREKRVWVYAKDVRQ